MLIACFIKYVTVTSTIGFFIIQTDFVGQRNFLAWNQVIARDKCFDKKVELHISRLGYSNGGQSISSSTLHRLAFKGLAAAKQRLQISNSMILKFNRFFLSLEPFPPNYLNPFRPTALCTVTKCFLPLPLFCSARDITSLSVTFLHNLLNLGF